MPDRILEAAEGLRDEMRGLRADVRQLHDDRDRDRRTAILARLLAVIVVIAIVGGFVIIRNHDNRARAETRCTIYEKSVRDHAVTIKYLRLGVKSVEGKTFVDGLENAYKADDARYYHDLNLSCGQTA